MTGLAAGVLVRMHPKSFTSLLLVLLSGSGLTLGAQTRLADRIGFYQWAGALPRGADADLLTEARRRTVELDSSLFRIYVGARYDYVHPLYSPRRFQGDDVAGALTPAKIMAISRYKAVLEDPAIRTAILTVYPIRDYGGGPDDLNLYRPWSERERSVEFEQTRELCRYLYREFGDIGKTVIIANTEADHMLLEIMNHTGSPDLAVENLRQWTNTRFQAIREVRRAHPGARLRVLHAFEISIVNLRIVAEAGHFRKAPSTIGRTGWNALYDVVPQVSFDLLSYSAYEAANSPYENQDINTDAALTGVRLKRDLGTIRKEARDSLSMTGRRAFGDNFVMIGEIGYPRERFDDLPTGGVLPRLQGALRAALDEACPYVVIWQVFDGLRAGDRDWGYGMYDRLGRIPRLNALPGECNSLRACLHSLIAGEVP